MSRTSGENDPKLDEILYLNTYRFDLKAKELQDTAGHSVPLRSQSGEVLAYLAAHEGTLVTKDALIAAVWPDTFVTDDSIVQCIGDIRRALGDDAHMIIQTFPKKGYKLVASKGASPPPQRARALGQFHPVLIALLGVVLVIGGWVVFAQRNSPTPPGDKPTIAVLPFDDFSVGEDKGYLSDAIAEGVITELARSSLISVIARNSSFRYRDKDTDIRQIGEELGVHYLLEGSKQKSGDNLKVTVQLIDAASGQHLWAHTYDQKIGDLFTVQDAIIKTVANRIGFRIERPVPGADPDKVTAFHLYLQALEMVKKNFNAEVHAEITKIYKQVIEIDPDAQYGYIGLAHTYRASAAFGYKGITEEEALKLGFEAANTALDIAPDDPEVHYVLARLHGEAGNINEARSAYDKAIAMNPSAANYITASTDTYLYTGQPEVAIERLKEAMGIDPFHADWLHWQMGWALWEVEDCEGALASMQKMKQIRRSAHRMLAGIYACLGEVEKAQEAYQVFYAEANEPTVAEQRAEWKDLWTAPGSLERFLDHMRIAGMKD